MSAIRLDGNQTRDLVAQATDALRHGILTGAFLPGEQLKERQAAEQLGFSRNTMRQALARIVAEGFATAVPRVGVFVRRMTDDEQRDVAEYRIGFETAAAVLACRNASSEELEALEALGAETDSWFRAIVDSAEWDWNMLLECEIAFHGRLIELSHNVELNRTVSRAQVAFWLYFLFKGNNPGYFLVREMPVPHVGIVRAIASRDPGKAAIAVHDHLAHNLDSLDQALGKGGESAS